MTDAPLKQAQTGQPAPDEREGSETLDNSAIHELLESRSSGHHGDPIIGIGNGLVAGAVLWILIALALFIAL